MLRRLIVLDVALLVLLVLGGVKFREDWRAFGPLHQVAAIKPAPEVFPTLPVASFTVPAAGEDWTEIPSRNPFSFDRTDIAILAPTEPPKPPGPKPILFGIASLGNGPIAMLANGQAGNRNSRPMKVGESMDGWTIVQIESKSITIESGGVRQILVMNDPTAQVPRDYTRTLASPGASPSVIQATSPAAPAVSPSTSVNTPAATSSPAPGQKRTRTIQTPFGPKVIEEDPQ